MLKVNNSITHEYSSLLTISVRMDPINLLLLLVLVWLLAKAVVDVEVDVDVVAAANVESVAGRYHLPVDLLFLVQSCSAYVAHWSRSRDQTVAFHKGD